MLKELLMPELVLEIGVDRLLISGVRSFPVRMLLMRVLLNQPFELPLRITRHESETTVVGRPNPSRFLVGEGKHVGVNSPLE